MKNRITARITVLFLMGIVSLLSTTDSSAELITLNSGTVIRANIEKITPVYIRTAYRGPGRRREFLVEEIQKIEQDKTQDQQISELAIKNIELRQNDPSGKRLRQLAMQKAVEIVAEVMQNMSTESLQETPPDVRLAAMEIANELIRKAMEETGPAAAKPLDQDVRHQARQQVEALFKKNPPPSAEADEKVLPHPVDPEELLKPLAAPPALELDTDELFAVKHPVPETPEETPSSTQPEEPSVSMLQFNLEIPEGKAGLAADAPDQKDSPPPNKTGPQKYTEHLIQSNEHQEIIMMVPVEEDQLASPSEANK